MRCRDSPGVCCVGVRWCVQVLHVYHATQGKVSAGEHGTVCPLPFGSSGEVHNCN